jgi:acyl-CoA reductase-like NAD-dependent aldehyde dehydrogenase
VISSPDSPLVTPDRSAAEDDALLTAEVDAMASRASRAQGAFESWNDDRIDALLHDLADAFADAAEELAIATVAETGMGSVLDKTFKNQFASLGVYASFAGKPGQGTLTVDAARQVAEVASPVGVVFGVVPVTNPVATAMFKTLIALKGRNALILSFHHRALGVAERTGAIVRGVLKAHGAPLDLVQWVRRAGGRATTKKLMSHPLVSMILATGGTGLVKAAYSSGTPAIGVGPGNAPVLICPDADLDEAARAIVQSKTFDNGLICGAEHNLVVDQRVVQPFLVALTLEGAAVLTGEEERRFFATAVDAGSQSIRSEWIGQTAAAIAAGAGIERPYPIRLLIVRAGLEHLEGVYAGEKLAPFLSLFTVAGEDEGLALCRTLLRHVGAGYTAIIHTASPERVDRFARAIPAGRILVNSPAAQGCCGMTTGLECSLTLGCGTFGGNSTTDNVTFRHLLNIKRVAYGRASQTDEG